MQNARAIKSAARSTSRLEKNNALGFPVVPLDVCSLSTSWRGTASNPSG